MRRFAALIVALAAWASVGAAPAFADGPPPLPIPSGISGPTPTVTARPKPGPTYVVTPGSPGSTLPTAGQPPVTTPMATPVGSTAGHAGQGAKARTGAGNATPEVGVQAASSPLDSDRWWMIGAAVLLLVVLLDGAGGLLRRPTRSPER